MSSSPMTSPSLMTSSPAFFHDNHGRRRPPAVPFFWILKKKYPWRIDLVRHD
jgi:hypothetical protein